MSLSEVSIGASRKKKIVRNKICKTKDKNFRPGCSFAYSTLIPQNKEQKNRNVYKKEKCRYFLMQNCKNRTKKSADLGEMYL
ncbi:MAG: hypothetical protein M5F18_04190 [Asgard group archaeon]|nr:hypothetical protein [Asgard group archaeon]